MLQGLSRKTLNIIILVCLVAVVWLNMAGKHPDQPIPEPLKLPPLHNDGWRNWNNQEQVTVLLHAGGTIDGGTLVIRSAEQNLHITLPASDWSISLYAALKTAPSDQPAAILISGPWSDNEKQAIAALVIREQKLLPLQQITHSTELWPACVRNHLPGSLWLAQQQGLEWQQLGQLPLQLNPDTVLPSQQEWEVWRLQQSRELRRHWQDEQSQIDIQADLAYHRLPTQAYSDLYLALADAQPGDVAAALSCLTQNDEQPPGENTANE